MFTPLILLYSESADVFAKDNESNTPLMSAVQEGHIEVFCNLLKKVDVALADTDEDGRTVVHMAAELNHNELLRVSSSFKMSVHTYSGIIGIIGVWEIMKKNNVWMHILCR